MLFNLSYSFNAFMDTFLLKLSHFSSNGESKTAKYVALPKKMREEVCRLIF